MASGSLKISDFLASTTSSDTVTKIISDNIFRKGWLEFTRKLIEEAKLDKTFLSSVEAKIRLAYVTPFEFDFVQAQTARDLQGLNGAGFYESKAGCLSRWRWQRSGSFSVHDSKKKWSVQRAYYLFAKKRIRFFNKDLIADLEED